MKRMMTFLILCVVLSGCAKTAVLTEGVFHLQNVSITAPEGQRLAATYKQFDQLLGTNYAVVGEWDSVSLVASLDFSSELLEAPDGFFKKIDNIGTSVSFEFLPEGDEVRAEVFTLSFNPVGESEDEWVSATREELEAIEVSLSAITFDDSLFTKEDEYYNQEMEDPEELLQMAVFFSYTVEGYQIEGELHTKSYKGLTIIGGYHL